VFRRPTAFGKIYRACQRGEKWSDTYLAFPSSGNCGQKRKSFELA
jgi:hypothetical protein